MKEFFTTAFEIVGIIILLVIAGSIYGSFGLNGLYATIGVLGLGLMIPVVIMLVTMSDRLKQIETILKGGKKET